jgi:3-hydroxyacyl-CoA dehydrogenase
VVDTIDTAWGSAPMRTLQLADFIGPDTGLSTMRVLDEDVPGSSINSRKNAWRLSVRNCVKTNT